MDSSDELMKTSKIKIHAALKRGRRSSLRVRDAIARIQHRFPKAAMYLNTQVQRHVQKMECSYALFHERLDRGLEMQKTIGFTSAMLCHELDIGTRQLDRLVQESASMTELE